MRKIAKKFLAASLVLSLLAGFGVVSSFASSESGEIYDIAVESSIFKCKFNHDKKTVEILGVEGANYIEIESPSAVENLRLYEIKTRTLIIPESIFGYGVVGITGEYYGFDKIVLPKGLERIYNFESDCKELVLPETLEEVSDDSVFIRVEKIKILINPDDRSLLSKAKQIAKQMKLCIEGNFKEIIEDGDDGKEYYCLSRLTEGDYLLGTNAYGEYPSQYMN